MAIRDQRHTNATHGTRARRRPFRARGGLVGSAIVLASLGASSAAEAQMDVAPPLPNVLILLDTSGSMERLPNGQLPAIDTVTASIDPMQKSRWIDALEVLGGDFVNYSAIQVPRNTVDFANEYSLVSSGASAPPYDYGYYLPHFRPMANGCTPGPAVPKGPWPFTYPALSTAPYTQSFGPTSFGWRTYTGATPALSPLQMTNCPSAATPSNIQDSLGVLSTFQYQARFGLMTFDNLPAPNTGYPGSVQSALDGVTGQWSYFPGWYNSTASATFGWPSGCSATADPATAHAFEVGARNPGAPPWEGPLVPLASADDATTLTTVNNQIRYAMFAMRPYGATPIGPMMADAYYYYRGDPHGPAQVDPQNACRGSFIILITDGFPNEDLRPGCQDTTDPNTQNTFPLTPYPGSPPTCTSTSPGCCPSMRAEDIAFQLANPPAGTPPVKTFVVGFSLSDESTPPNPIYCTEDDTQFGPPLQPLVDCAAGSAYLAKYPQNTPCCTLDNIAYNGGTGQAYIASSADTLRAALVSAMSAATASTSTSRTVPVFVSASSSTTGGQYQFQSSFKVSPFGAWTGTLERVRWTCQGTPLAPTQQTFSPTLGDDFAANLNSAPANRHFLSWNGVILGSGGTLSHDSTGTVRPNYPPASGDTDGVEKIPGVAIPNSYAPPTSTTSTSGPNFVSDPNMTYQVMSLSSTCLANPTDTTANPDGCKQKYLNFALGQSQPNAAWYTRVGNAFGDIYHATPVNVGLPNAFIRDSSYAAFRAGQLSRPPVLLAATNDGILHAFQEDVTTETQNELWGFVPPRVMTAIPSIYGGGHALLMDSAPVAKDVAFGPSGSSTSQPWGRSRLDVRAGKANWRTVVVGGITAGGGYYALDVTDTNHPQFLWQLTKDQGLPLFGSTPGTPAIGAVYYRESLGQDPIETPVAFLPGGADAPWTANQSCPRWDATSALYPLPANTRASARCFVGAAESFTVVRLWDGKVLRSFRNNPAGDGTANHPIDATSPVTLMQTGAAPLNPVPSFSGIDSPITGAVALYPAGTGSVTTRAFVGDIDGTLWKVDVSNADPQNWTFQIFHDAYGLETGSTAAMMGQPIATQPITTVDRVGDITVLYATGDQNTFASTNVNHVWSVTERTSYNATSGITTFTPIVNWHLRFDTGLTPTGPLTLFNQMVYFSTFSPDSAVAGACLNGSGTLWSMNYLDDSKVDSLPMPGFTLGAGEAIGASTAGSGYSIPSTCRYGGTASAPASFANQPDPTQPTFRCIALDPGSVVFGAGITERPTCVATSAMPFDPYTGMTTSHQDVSAVTPGNFQLVVQTGPTAGTGAGGSTTKTLPRTLVAPVSQTRVSSWASIVE